MARVLGRRGQSVVARSLQDDEGAWYGLVSRIDVWAFISFLPPPLGVVIQISKSVCLPLAFSFPLALHFSHTLLASPPFLSSPGNSTVTMETRGRAFAYYTLCVTS